MKTFRKWNEDGQPRVIVELSVEEARDMVSRSDRSVQAIGDLVDALDAYFATYED